MSAEHLPLFKRYKKLEEVGSGGMGRVYKGVDIVFNREIALKVLSLDSSNTLLNPERFFDEAKTVANLQHPNIVPIFDYGCEGGVHFFVMPFFRNGTLTTKINKGALPFENTDRWFTQIASALAYAHKNLIIHRDLKPSNILIDDDENARLADFGISIMKNEINENIASTLVGTPDYMAPGQFNPSHHTDERDDIYALGIVLYEMLTGQLPFTGELSELAVKHKSERPPSPSSVKQGIPLYIDRVVLKALAKNPNDRYESVMEFLKYWEKASQNFSNKQNRETAQFPAVEELSSEFIKSSVLVNVQKFRLPPGSRMPYPQNRAFTGRDVEIDLVEEYLFPKTEENHNDIPTPLIMAGIGGVGKTQLAVEICYRLSSRFRGIHWIDASQNIENEISACGARMGLTYWPEKLEDQINLTVFEWERSGPRLLVLDNVDNPTQLQDWLARLGNFFIIITSKITEWPVDLGLQVIILEPFDENASCDLIRKVASRFYSTPNKELLPVVHALGNLPLGLDLAGRYLENNQYLSPEDFWNEFVDDRLDHESLSNETEYSPTRHITNLRTMFTLVWNKLSEKTIIDVFAKHIFFMCGYCAPGKLIPMSILSVMIDMHERQHLVEQLEKYEKRKSGINAIYKGALKRLENLGLLLIASDGIIIHPLYKLFSQEQNKYSDFLLPHLVEQALKIIDREITSRITGECRSIVEHIQTIAEENEVEFPDLSMTLWGRLGDYYTFIGGYKEAKGYLHRALALTDIVQEDNNKLQVFDWKSNLFVALSELGEFDSAGLVSRDLLQDIETLGPDYSLRKGWLLSNIGSFYETRADYNSALNMYLEAEKLFSLLDEPEKSYRLIQIWNDIGKIHISGFENLKLGEKYLDRAIDLINEKFDSPNERISKDLPIILMNLSQAMRPLVKTETVKEMVQKALDYLLDTYGELHPQVANCFTFLGSVLMDLGDYDVARENLEKSLTIKTEIFGENSHHLISSLNYLSQLFQYVDEMEKSETFAKRALKIAETIFGNDSVQATSELFRLGNSYIVRKRFDDAQYILERSIQILDDKHIKNRQTAFMISSLAYVLNEKGEDAKAKSLYKEVIKILDDKPIDDLVYEDTRAYMAYAQMLSGFDEHRKAVKYVQKAIRIKEQRFGFDLQNLITDYLFLSTLYFLSDKYEKSLGLLTKLLDINKTGIDPESRLYALLLTQQGVTQSAIGSYQKSCEDFSKAITIYSNLFDPTYSDKQEIALLHLYKGGALIGQKRMEEARVETKASFEMLRKVEEITDYQVQNIFNEIIEQFLVTGAIDEAEECANTKIDCLKRNNCDKNVILIELKNIGYRYMKVKQFTKAIEFYAKALAIAENLYPEVEKIISGEEGGTRSISVPVSLSTVGTILNNIGLLYFASGDKNMAKAYALRAYEYSGEKWIIPIDIEIPKHTMGYLGIFEEIWGKDKEPDL